MEISKGDIILTRENKISTLDGKFETLIYLIKLVV